MSTPPERTVGFGIRWPEAPLTVSCGRCRAPEGAPCRSPRQLIKDGYHAVRGDRARRLHQGKTVNLMGKLENAALRRDPDGPLWGIRSVPHQCGVLGAHVLTDCTPAVESSST